MKRVLVSFLLILVSSIVFFFFWGSSTASSLGDYEEIETYDPTSTPHQLGDTISIITYNLGYLSGMTNNLPLERTETLFTNHLAQAKELLHNTQPDIVAFQEIDFGADRSFNVDQLYALSTSHSFTSASRAINWDKRYVPFPYWPVSMHFGKVVSGQAILSRFPIINNDIHTLVKPEGNPFYYNAFYIDRLAQVSTIKIGKQPLFVINVHLEAFHADTREIQIRTVLKLFHQYSEQYPVILCGDFNSTPPHASEPWQDDHVIQTLLADYQMEMAIGLTENAKNESDYFTFSSESPSKRIDYFFYNPKFIQFIDARVIHEAGTISDHLPVSMRFVLR
jgi:endonuclease/exonuclease/phosphatase family metal-dependent hydrolase